jgi:hypothetical protein
MMSKLRLQIEGENAEELEMYLKASLMSSFIFELKYNMFHDWHDCYFPEKIKNDLGEEDSEGYWKRWHIAKDSFEIIWKRILTELKNHGLYDD